MRFITNQSIIVWTLKTKSLLPFLYEREEFPSLEKRGKGRFLDEYV
jgi:hypothetical protein